jgi:hypothetical protein
LRHKNEEEGEGYKGERIPLSFGNEGSEELRLTPTLRNDTWKAAAVPVGRDDETWLLLRKIVLDIRRSATIGAIEFPSGDIRRRCSRLFYSTLKSILYAPLPVDGST